MTDAEKKKHAAAEAAIALVEDGMTLGLGSGSTAEIFVALLGRKMAKGLKVAGVPTSENTADAARRSGVPILDPATVTMIDLTVDGTDEVDAEFRLIKGGGGCLLREKIVAAASATMVVIADDTKKVDALGGFPLPVEVDRFWWEQTSRHVSAALGEAGCGGRTAKLRVAGDGAPFVTDGGNFILDCECGKIPDPGKTAGLLSAIPGVVEHGLFIGLARTVILGGADGVEILKR